METFTRFLRRMVSFPFFQYHYWGLAKTRTADPLFYLHHGNIDRIWMSWQRRHELMDTDFGINFDEPLEMHGLFENTTYRPVIDADVGNLCYTYDHFW